jgi:hypothetical protein
LDRESVSQKEFTIEVRATDKGYPQHEGVTNVTIRVLDANDNPPVFEKPLYEGSIPETAPLDSAVLTVAAKDVDNEANDNIFSFDLVEPSDFFYMTTEELSTGSTIGVLRVKKVG